MVYTNTLQSISSKPNRQVTTNQGGKAYLVDDFQRTRRFLILGSEGGTYYTDAQTHTIENAQAVSRALDEDGVRVVDMIIDVSARGLAAKQQPTIFALALAASHPMSHVRGYALAAVPSVCRTGTQLFMFVDYVTKMRGWGRALKRAVAEWYTEPELSALVYQVTKYRNREGWTHADLLRVSHPTTRDSARNEIFKWIVDGDMPSEVTEDNRQLFGFRQAMEAETPEQIVNLITDYRLTREMIPTQFLTNQDVLFALLNEQPIGATIRNLGALSAHGVLTRGSEAERIVLERLGNKRRMRNVHPMKVYDALATYSQGHGTKGNLSWKPTARILDGLSDGFHLSFDYVTPTNKNILLAVDTSGSMGGGYGRLDRSSGYFYQSCSAHAAANALVTLATEPNAEVLGFDTKLQFPNISPKQRLDDVIKEFGKFGGGGTRCALPVEYAAKSKSAFDAVVIYTDSENGGDSIDSDVDRARKRVRDFRMVNVALVANSWSNNRSHDPLSLDVMGNSPDTPSIISQFIQGEF